MNKEIPGYLFVVYALLFFSIATIPIASAFEITTDEITQTSIVWNLTGRGEETIMEIALDGVLLDNYAPNATRIVQSGLSPGETHIISVTDTSFMLSELSAATLPEETSQEDTFLGTVNLWLLVLLALVFTFAAIFLRIPFVAFIGTVFCVLGLLSSIGNSFLTGLIFVIMTIVTVFVGFSK